MALEVITQKPSGDAKPTPLLFVHGILHGAWCWQEFFLPYFAEKGYHASTLSLRGHGNSSIKQSLRFTRIKHYVEDVNEAATQIQQETGQRPVVIGHSMGGLITQKYLEKYDAPAGVLLATAPVHGVYQAMFRALFGQPLAFLQVNLTLNLRPLASTPDRARWAFFSKDMPQEQVERYQQQFGIESYMAFLDMLLFALPRPKRVTAPILVVAGEHDTLFSVAEERKTANAYNGTCEVVPDAHDLMLEPHWQSTADNIVNWLNTQGL